jgi:hypothetical protein
MKQMVHNGPGALAVRGWQPRLSRPTVLFWWPAVLLTLLAGGLWLLWPHAHGRYGAAPRSMRLPEPGAAYVTLDEGAQSLYLKLDIFTSPSVLGYGRMQGGLDAREAPVARVRLPPERLPTRVDGPWRLAAVTVPPLLVPRLSEPPAEAPVAPVAPATNGVRTVLSPGLRRAAFAFEMPRAGLPAAPGRVRSHVDLDAAGRVSQLLIEKDDTPLDSRGAEEAISRGRGTGPAHGWVEIAWQ